MPKEQKNEDQNDIKGKSIERGRASWLQNLMIVAAATIGALGGYGLRESEQIERDRVAQIQKKFDDERVARAKNEKESVKIKPAIKTKEPKKSKEEMKEKPAEDGWEPDERLKFETDLAFKFVSKSKLLPKT